MDELLFLIFSLILLVIELIYFKIADRYNIIDHPNHRSSHAKVTIRGGGIIFCISLLSISAYSAWQYIYFTLGLVLICLISFVDDLKNINNKLRIIIHLVAVVLLLLEVGIYGLPIYFIVLSMVFAIGTINAINFMDGINGITGGFGLVSAITLFYINKYQVAFTNELYLITLIMSLLIFNFFNFRKTAKCFAGDVGSVGLAFILLFFLLQLITKTNSLNYIILFMIYGLDTSTTILFRIIKKENIFEAHRQHFYQFLANEKGMPHLMVASIYATVQALINIILIKYPVYTSSSLIWSICVGVCLVVIVRFYFEGAPKLLNLKQ